MTVERALLLVVLAGLLSPSVCRADATADAWRRDAARKEDERWRRSVYGPGPRSDPTPAPAGDRYAAIAYSAATGKYGYSYGWSSRASAERDALARCKAADARVLTWTRNSYCALAKGKNGAYAAAWGLTLNQAKAKALRECGKYGSDARVVQWVYSGR
jgi:hypothetical protein